MRFAVPLSVNQYAELLSEQARTQDNRLVHPGSLTAYESLDPQALLSWAIGRATPGNRNQTGFLFACRLRDQGVELLQAEALLTEFAAGVPQGDHSYTRCEALASVRQAYKRRPQLLPKMR